MQHFGAKVHLKSRETKEDRQDKIPAGSLTEFSLIALCKQGDRAAQKSLYDSLAPKMLAVCLRYMGEREAALDTLQEGFMTLFSKLDSYSGEGSFEGWARRVFVNTALMSLRKNDVLKQSEDIGNAWDISSEDTTPIQDISYKELIRMIGELPTGFRTVFNMYVIEGYSHKEIGEALGISEVTSRSQLQRARTILQGKIRNRK